MMRQTLTDQPDNCRYSAPQPSLRHRRVHCACQHPQPFLAAELPHFGQNRHVLGLQPATPNPPTQVAQPP